MQRPTRTQLTPYGPDGRRKYIAPSERTVFIRAARHCVRAKLGTLCLVIAYTGCRISEALSLRVASIERAEGFVAIRSLKKRGKFVVREVPVPLWLIAHLTEVHHLDMSEADVRLWNWSRGHAWALIKQVLRDAGIPRGPHQTAKGLRHGFAINALRCGVPINLVSRWLGHASLATTAIYLDVIGDEERELAARMWNDDTIEVAGEADHGPPRPTGSF